MVELLRPFGRCACDCTDLEWVAGEELKIREMEVA
jgi:hydrogenase nickel incorporation protein HypA/HybF